MQQYYKTTLNMLFLLRNITVFLLKIKNGNIFPIFILLLKVNH